MHILLVLAGECPGVDLLKSSMKNADLSVAVDGGIQPFVDNHLSPDIIIGDMDSISEISVNPITIKINEQDRTDLQKALDHIIGHFPVSRLTILGALGGRTDHLLNNLQICTHVDPHIEIVFKHDRLDADNFTHEKIIRLTPDSKSRIDTPKDSTLSVIQVVSFKDLSSEGLKWELEHERSSGVFLSQSNVALTDNPQITLGMGCVYIALYK